MKRALVALVVLLAGCATPAPDATRPASPTTPTQQEATLDALAASGCGSCYEPTLAWVNGTLFVSTGSGKDFSASDDGGRTFRNATPPPLPSGFSGVSFGDVILQADAVGSLWWSDLVTTSGPGATQGMRVARSDDGARSWTVNAVLRPSDVASPSADRNWLAFGPNGTVLAACTCPAGAAPMVATSRDRGASWTPFAPVPAQGRPGPIGPPAWSPTRGIVIPYLLGAGAGVAAASPHLESQGVGAVRSTDATLWTPTTVALDATPAGGFPGSAVVNGTFVASWSSVEGGPRVASSADGGATWSPPVVVAQGATEYPNAWVAASPDGRLAVAWFARNGTGLEYRVAVGAPAGPFTTLLSVPIRTPPANVLTTRANTDFPYVAWAPDARLAAVWSDGGVHVRVLSP